MIFLDSETCGLTGPMVLLQWAEDDGPIHLHNIFDETINDTLKVIEYICEREVCAFNLIFDWYHLTKIYNILRWMKDHAGIGDQKPPVEAVILVEEKNPSDWCLRAKSALDLMLFARKGPYQATLLKKEIYVNKIPSAIAPLLVEELTKRVKIPDIYFQRRPKGYQWELRESKTEGFHDVVLRFAPSTSLAAIAADALGEAKADWPIPSDIMPTERNWLPYGQYGDRPWGLVIYKHIQMWRQEKPRYYAWRDVDLLRKLYKKWDCPPVGDDDSILAMALGATRHRGFAVDTDKIPKLIKHYHKIMKSAPRAHGAVRRWLETFLTPLEKAFLKSTDKAHLQELEKWEDHPVAEPAGKVLKARKAQNRVSLLVKIQELKSYHPDFKVIGTRSSRMSGGSLEGKGGSINPQGIPKGDEFRSLFPFAYPGEELWGGDAKSFEISIIDAYFKDPTLHAELLSGKNFHGLIGAIWFDTTYEAVMASKENPGDIYDRSKNANFAMFYGAMIPKLAATLNLDEDVVEKRYQALSKKYPYITQGRERIQKQFEALSQPGGIGTKIIWKEPADYIESLLGFRRYFTLENQIIRALFDLAEKLPKEFQEHKEIVVRRDRPQTTYGAVKSALYAAAFNMQASNMRAASNHVIQSTGGQITKAVQVAIEKAQPVGVHRWYVRTMNNHDELETVSTIPTTQLVRNEILKFREKVPLLEWEWDRMRTWADK